MTEPIIGKSWGAPKSPPYTTPNIHIINSLHCYPSLPLSFLPTTSNWGQQKWDLSYRNPKSSSDWTIYCELWEGVKQNLLALAYNHTFGQWQPILDVIESFLYQRPQRRFESHLQDIGDSLLIHYYPFTNDYFNNRRIAKQLHNNIDPATPDQPPPKVRHTTFNC